MIPRFRAFAAGLLVLATAATAARASTVAPGTFAWDYRNVPVAAPLLGYETVALSPRALASPAADSLRAGGTKLLAWIQPAWSVWRGAAVRDFDYDACITSRVERFAAAMRDTLGRRVTLGDFTDAPRVIDFGTPGVGDTLAACVLETCARADGVLLDYGCGSLGWLAPDIPAETWDRWRAGWFTFVDRLRRARPEWRVIAQCDQFGPGLADHVDGLFLEKAGYSLNPNAKVWGALVGAAEKDPARGASGWIVRVEDRDAPRRRYFAALALATGAAFNASDLRGDAPGGTRDRSSKDAEHFALPLGAPTGPMRKVDAELLERRFARGFVLVHHGKASRRVRCPDGVTRTLAADDGLVVVHRDAAGRPAKARTNRDAATATE